MKKYPRFNIIKMSILLNLIYPQCNLSQNPRKLLFRYQQTDSKGYVKRHKIESIWKETNIIRGLTLPYFKSNYKARLT